MDAEYWKARCEAAEKALQLARSAVPMSPPRKRVLAFLADLTAGVNADTNRLADVLECTPRNAYTALSRLADVGLVEREKGRRGRKGHPSGWKLGHMVQVEASE